MKRRKVKRMRMKIRQWWERQFVLKITLGVYLVVLLDKV